MMGRAGDIPLQFDAGWPSLHRNCLSIYAGETLQLRHTSWLRLHLKVCRHTHCLNEYFWDGEGFLLGRLFLLPIRCLLHRIARHLPLESLYSLSEQNPSQALQRAFSLSEPHPSLYSLSEPLAVPIDIFCGCIPSGLQRPATVC